MELFINVKAIQKSNKRHRENGGGGELDNNLDSSKEQIQLINDFKEFLLQTGKFKKLLKLLNKQICINTKTCDTSLKNNLTNLFNIQKAESKKEYALKNFQKEYATLYILNNEIKNFTLNATNALDTFKNTFFESDKKLSKQFCAALLIEYFSLLNNKEKFFMPTDFETPAYYLLTFLYNEQESYGARLYWDKYNRFTKELLNENLNFPHKKVAICFYGVLRGAWEENLQDIIDVVAKPLSADCFLFSWDEYQQYPSLMGGYHWADRVLKKPFGEIVPKEIKTHSTFRPLLPNTYEKLQTEYNVKIPKNKIKKFKQKNKEIKEINLVSQYDLPEIVYKTYNGKLYYGYEQTFELMRKYEFKTKTDYDLVIILRSDIRPTEVNINKIQNIQLNEIADNFFGWGSGSGCFVGHKQVVKNYIGMLKHQNVIIKNKFLATDIGNNHAMGYKYPVLFGIRIIKPLVSFDIYHTKALNGMNCLPDFKKQLELDLKNAIDSGKINYETKEQIEDFFQKLRAEYKLPLKNANTFNRITGKTTLHGSKWFQRFIKKLKNSTKKRIDSLKKFIKAN